MKKFTYIFLSLFLISTFTFAQSEVEAIKFSRNDLHGTARSMAMGGAFGALGGDQTAVGINPAGIGVYRSSEIMVTANLTKETSSVGGKNSSVNNFAFDNMGFVGYFPLRNDVMPMINFGFTYSRQKTLQKEISGGGSPANSLMDYIVDRTNNANNGAGISPEFLRLPGENDNFPDPFNDQPWLSVLGYNSYLINPHQDAQGHFYTPLDVRGQQPLSQIITSERGYIDNYDFTVGTTINNVLNLGMALTVSEMSYNLKSDYLEDYSGGGFTLTNWLTTSGAGFGAKIGMIYRPVNQVRLGLAYHTPKWYALTETYEAEIVDDMGSYVTEAGYEPSKTYSARFSNNYNLKVPGKWVASAALVLGSNFIASVDYELVNYNNMKLAVPGARNDDSDWYEFDNEYISTDFKPTSTIKVGMEYRFTQQFSGRLGYAWMQNPYETKFQNMGNAAVAGSNTIYRMEGNANYFTGGLGYRFSKNFYLDLAMVYKIQNDDLYPFPSIYTDSEQLVVDGSPFALKNTSFRGLLTLGYRF